MSISFWKFILYCSELRRILFSQSDDMKKIYLILALAFASCTKQHVEPQQLSQPKSQQFFSRVQYFKDGRQPSTDTVWTLQMLNQQMVDQFRKDDGKVYWESTIVKEVGVLWAK